MNEIYARFRGFMSRIWDNVSLSAPDKVSPLPEKPTYSNDNVEAAMSINNAYTHPNKQISSVDESLNDILERCDQITSRICKRQNYSFTDEDIKAVYWASNELGEIRNHCKEIIASASAKETSNLQDRKKLEALGKRTIILKEFIKNQFENENE